MNEQTTQTKVDLAAFSPKGFDKGAAKWKIGLWFAVNALVVKAQWNPFMGLKRALLRMFGAKIGKGLVVKNGVNVKFPWKLTVGDNCWLGENCWIDNLDRVTLGDNVCISQGATLLTGNHDYSRSNMPYRNAPIVVEDGAWIGAQSTVCPGVTVQRGAVLTVGSVATKDLEAHGIYQGNPARKIRERTIRQA